MPIERMDQEKRFYRRAYLLSLFTIFYNIMEGLISITMGYEDQTLTLFGFGVDSFIEVISGIGIAVMILRIRQNPDRIRTKSEVTALKITGTAFYLLSAGLLVGIFLNTIHQQKPETTLWGIIIAILSIFVMSWLMIAKRKVGTQLKSEPIISDSNCTRICVYLSIVLLISSLVYELTGFPYSDSIGALGLIFFSFREGKEAFGKAKGMVRSCGRCED